MTGRREASKARKRAAIIEAGIRLMHEQGYEAASTTAIARAAGVSPATLFNYFPTKASIVFADDDLWAPQPGPVRAGGTPDETLAEIMLDLLDQPGWTRPADDELTRLRFALVRQEPALRQEQIVRAFALVPRFADALRTAHPDLDHDTVLAKSGAIVGAGLATLFWGRDHDIRSLLSTALLAGSGSADGLPAS